MSDLRDAGSDIQNPELIPLLRGMDPRGGIAPFTTAEKRSAYRAAVSRWGAVEPIASAVDRTVPGVAGEIPVRIYSPIYGHKLGDGPNLPVILYLHGGGFISGDLDTHDPVCRMLSNHVPAVVVAVNYRLAPEDPYPAATEDCWSVLSWLAAHASSVGGDARRISVVGDSAGGNLAAVMALMARDTLIARGVGPLSAQVLIYPMLDATLSCGSLVENAFIPPFTLVDCVKVWQMYLGTAVDRRDAYISPLQAESLAGLPAALVITGEYDILSDEGEAYARRLRAAGVPTQHEAFQGMVHGFFQWPGTVAAARLAMNRVVQFLQHAVNQVAS